MKGEEGTAARWRQAFAGLSEQAAPRPDCPDPDRLWAAATAESPPAERHEIFDHIASCASCAAAFRLARGLSASSQEKSSQIAPFPRLQPRRWQRWSAAFAAAAAVLVLAVLLPRWWNRPELYRGGEASEILSQIPDDAPLPRGQADLRWTAGPPGSQYEIRVLTRDGREIAVESGLTEAHYRIPPSALSGVPAGTVLYWQVKALQPDGKSLGSKTFSARLE
jgi:hypothetical protein